MEAFQAQRALVGGEEYHMIVYAIPTALRL